MLTPPSPSIEHVIDTLSNLGHPLRQPASDETRRQLLNRHSGYRRKYKVILEELEQLRRVRAIVHEMWLEGHAYTWDQLPPVTRPRARARWLSKIEAHHALCQQGQEQWEAVLKNVYVGLPQMKRLERFNIHRPINRKPKKKYVINHAHGPSKATLVLTADFGAKL